MANGPHRAGYQASRIDDAARSRQVQLDVWYPTLADETAHGYGLSTGRVAAGAAVASGTFPLMLLSHGALGDATNYSWIAEYLSRHGFVIVGVSHFGESPVFGQATVDPTTVSRFGARTRDLAFALEFVLRRSQWASAIDPARIGAIGHSSGGATVVMLAGGRYQPESMAAYCRSQAGSGDKGCRYPAATAAAGEDDIPVADGRVRAIVLLDPAVGPAFDQATLAEVKVPALVVGSVDNDFVPFASHAGRYAALLSNVEALRLDGGEGHFVYLDECSSTIEAMGVRLCADRPGVVRKDVHARLSARVLTFLNRHLAII